MGAEEHQSEGKKKLQYERSRAGIFRSSLRMAKQDPSTNTWHAGCSMIRDVRSPRVIAYCTLQSGVEVKVDLVEAPREIDFSGSGGVDS